LSSRTWISAAGGRPPLTYTGDDGAPHTYASNAAAVYIEKGWDITIRNCILRECGNGLFAGAYGGASSNLLVEGCRIYDNGNTNSIYEHNNYTEVSGITFQYNWFGKLRLNCSGNNLKDRSAGCVIRYNWIEGGNRQLDLVESDYPALASQPAYSNTWVYGNLLVEPNDDGNSQIVHYGGDGGDTTLYRKGTLHFFNNTVISRRTGNTTLFRLSSNNEKADCRNNIVWVSGAGSSLAMLDSSGRLDLRNDWFKTGWVNSHSGLSGTISNLGGVITGTVPGFADDATQDYHLTNGSPCIGRATNAPVAVARQYVRNQRGEPQPADAALDLGAYEFAAARAVDDDAIFIHHSCGANWLANSLDSALQNKDYVDERNDITYGTDLAPDAGRPDSLASVPGDSTDMQHWIRWFNDYLGGVKTYACADGTNRIVLFKSCYPLSDVGSDGTEPGNPFSGTLTIANYKAVYRCYGGPGGVYTNGGYTYRPIEDLFAANPGILFIPVTAPPLTYAGTTDANAHRARLFNNWLKIDWLASYNAAHPGMNNVAVWDWFDYLTYPDNDASHPNRLKGEYGGSGGDAHPNGLANTNSTQVFAVLRDNFVDRAWFAFRHADHDGDGIPDWWELANSGDPTNMTETSDRDGDWMSDRAEYTSGTDPNNATSFFQCLEKSSAGPPPPAVCTRSTQQRTHWSRLTGHWSLLPSPPLRR